MYSVLLGGIAYGVYASRHAAERDIPRLYKGGTVVPA